MLDSITPVILTFDEAPNIGRCLDQLGWAKEVVVVDSGSTDGTQAICARHRNVRLVTRPFDNHANQWNFAIAQTGIAGDWVLALDADYMLSDAVVEELRGLHPADDVDGYWLNFRYAVYGKVLRSGIYPPVLSLFRRASGRYVQDGHTQRAKVDGGVGRLRATAIHDDRKPFSRWLRSQSTYAQLEAEKLDHANPGLKGFLRTRTPFSPIVMGLYCLILRGALFDGPPGWFYALQRTLAEAMIAAALLDRRLGRAPD